MSTAVPSERELQVRQEAQAMRQRQDRELSRKGRIVWWLALVGMIALPLLHEAARRRALRPVEQPNTMRYTNLEKRQVNFTVNWQQVPSSQTLPVVTVEGAPHTVTLEGDPRQPHELHPAVTTAKGTVPGRYKGTIEFQETNGQGMGISLPLEVLVQDPFAAFRWGLLFCCAMWALYAVVAYRRNPPPCGWLRYAELGLGTVSNPADSLRTQFIGRSSRAWMFFLAMALAYVGLWQAFRFDSTFAFEMWKPKALLAGVPLGLVIVFLSTQPYSRSYVDLQALAGRSFPDCTLIFSRGLFSFKRVGLTMRVWDPRREKMRVLDVWPRNAAQADQGTEAPPVLGGDWRAVGTPFTRIVTAPDNETPTRRLCFCYAWQLKQDER